MIVVFMDGKTQRQGVDGEKEGVKNRTRTESRRVEEKARLNETQKE